MHYLLDPFSELTGKHTIKLIIFHNNSMEKAKKENEDDTNLTRIGIKSSDISLTSDMGFKTGFDPFKKAEMILAEKHRRARLIRKVAQAMKNPKTEKCECCGFPIDAEPFSINCSLKEIAELGAGYPLFFIFIKFLGLSFVGALCIVAIPCIIGNGIADKGDEWESDKDSWIVKSSVGNNGDSNEIYPLWQCALHVAFMALVILFYHIARRYIAQKDKEMDLEVITAKDYTVHVSGLSIDVTEAEIKEFFEKHGRFDNQPAKVVKVNFPYKIKEYIDNSRRFEEISESLQLIDNYKQKNLEIPKKGCLKKVIYDEEALKKELEKISAERKKFEEDLPAGVGRDLLIGQAFVTFNTQADARAVEMQHGRQWAYRLWEWILMTLCLCCIRNRTQHRLKGKKIYARMANEPSDVFWENLEVSFRDRIKNSIKTWLATLLAVSVSFGMVYGMKILGKRQKENYNRDDDNDSWTIRILSIWPSIVIIIINFIIGRSTRYFASFERPHTVTAYNASVAIKLTFAMFFNTAVIAIIVSYDWEEDWFKPGGLVTDATYILISNAFVSPLIYLASPMVCVHKLRMRKVEKAEYISQIDANTMFENPSVDIAQRYANMNKTILLTFFYAPLVPVGFIFSLCGIFFEYWVSKYLLLRRHSWPKRLSGELSAVMIQVIPWAILLYSIMNYIYMNYLNPDNSGLAFIWMLIMLGYIFLPLDSIFSCFIKRSITIWDELYANKNYDVMAAEFIDDYDRSNPVTVHEGWEWLVEHIYKKQAIDDEHMKKIKKGLEKRSDMALKNMQYYARSRQNVDQLEAKKFGLGLLANVAKVNQPNNVPFHQDSSLMEIQNIVNQYRGNALNAAYQPSYQLNPVASSYVAPVNNYSQAQGYNQPISSYMPTYSPGYNNSNYSQGYQNYSSNQGQYNQNYYQNSGYVNDPRMMQGYPQVNNYHPNLPISHQPNYHHNAYNYYRQAW